MKNNDVMLEHGGSKFMKVSNSIETFIMRISHAILDDDESLFMSKTKGIESFCDNENNHFIARYETYYINDMEITFRSIDLENYIISNVININSVPSMKYFIEDNMKYKTEYILYDIDPNTLLDLISLKWNICSNQCKCRKCNEHDCINKFCTIACLKQESIPVKCDKYTKESFFYCTYKNI